MKKGNKLRNIALMLVIISAFALSTAARTSVQVGETNLTIWDTSDNYVVYDNTVTRIYANYTNITSGNSIEGADCVFRIGSGTYNLTYNSTTNFYDADQSELGIAFAAGTSNYNVTCNKTGFETLTANDTLNITNRNPSIAVIPDIIVYEDSYETINLSVYSSDPDVISGHNTTLRWNLTPADNLTFSVNNATGILNATPSADFYGTAETVITVIDELNATNASETVNIIIVNRPEINLTSPENNNNESFSSETIIFRAIVGDDFEFEECRLIINGSINQTNTSYIPHNATETIISDDDGTRDSQREINTDSGIVNITKQLIINTDGVDKILIYAAKSADFIYMEYHAVYVNGIKIANITNSDVSGTYSWIEIEADESYFSFDSVNNITIEVDTTNPYFSFLNIGTDTSNDYGRSFYNGSVDETGEYMIRLTYNPNEARFNLTGLEKGEHTWNVECENNRSETGSAEYDFNLTILDSEPSTPTYIRCDGNECSGTVTTQSGIVDLSCGGSVDADGDEFNYEIYYKETTTDELEYEFLTEFDGASYLWNVSNYNNKRFELRCLPSGTENELITPNFTISIGGAPEINSSLITCNGGQCNNSEFTVDLIDIACNATDPQDDPMTFRVEAKYSIVGESEWHNITDYDESDDANIITWNSSEIYSQSNVSIKCFASDGYFETESDELGNITLIKNSAPAKPTISTESINNGAGANISCEGSGDISYIIYVFYKAAKFLDSVWEYLGTAGINEEIFWNASRVYEQTAAFRCVATDGTYTSVPSDNAYETIAHPPTIPTELEPESNQNFEYTLNVSCSGSNNSDGFSYEIDAYYAGAGAAQWHTASAEFSGITEIENDSTDAELIAYDDGESSSSQIINVLINISQSDYKICVKSKEAGTQSGSLELGYNCEYSGSNLVCSNSKTITDSLSSDYEYYCKNITLATQGIKILKFQNRAGAYIDSVAFTALPETVDVSGIQRQEGVMLRCRAQDSQGYSDYIYSENISIDRIPKFNTSMTIGYNDRTIGNSITDNSIVMEVGTSVNGIFLLSEYFYDEDGDAMNYSYTGSSPLGITINSTTGNVSLSASSEGTGTIRFSADDNITTGYSPEISVEVYRSSSGGRRGNDDNPVVEIPDDKEVKFEEPDDEEEQREDPPVKESPSGGGKKNDTIVVDTIVKNVFDTKVKHSRAYFVSRGKTRIIERIKNVGFYDLKDIVIRITIPKSIEDSASDIIAVDPFQIIESDPIIGFSISSLPMDDETEVSYIIQKSLTSFDIENIGIDIVPRELTPEEIRQQEEEIQRRIDNTSQYLTIGKKHNINLEKQQTEFTIDLGLKEGTILYNVSIFAEIPKCLVEILKDEMIESDIEFEIINEDPLIKWHFDQISSSEQINYQIKKVTDEDCANNMSVMPLAHTILLMTAKANLFNAIIPLVFVPLIIGFITFFASYGFEKKENLSSLEQVIRWVRQKKREKLSWEDIAKRLNLARYKENTINEIKKFSSSTIKLWMTKLEIEVEEAILVIIIIMSVLDFLKLLPGEIEFAKLVISWTLMGYILYHAKITKVLFGKRRKLIDITLILAMFMMIMKNFVRIAETEFLEAGFMKDMYIFVAGHAFWFESILLIAGIIIIAATTAYIAWSTKINKVSFMGALGIHGEKKGIFTFIIRHFFAFLSCTFFFIAIFNIMMEWLAIAIDSALLTAAIIFYFFVLIKHKEKHRLVAMLYKVGNVGEKFYKNFVNLFHNRRTIFIGITGVLILHTLTDIGIFIVPYVLGLKNPIYISSWETGHTPVMNLYGWLQALFGIAPASSSLFGQGITGMGLSYSVILFALYSMNIIAIVFLLTVHSYVWWHLYRNCRKPVEYVKKLFLGKVILSLFASSITAYILTGAFEVKGLFLKDNLGVDIITKNIALNPNLDLVLGVSLAIGILAYVLMSVSDLAKEFINWLAVTVSFIFFFRYIILFFMSLATYYFSIITASNHGNILITGILIIFMSMTFVLYTAGIIAMIFELWLRNELMLRVLIPVKKVPKWMSYFDMGYIHTEEEHSEEEHGEKSEAVKDYVLSEIRKGHRLQSILHHLVKLGWSDSAIESGIKELRKSHEFMRYLAKYPVNNKSIAKIAEYIKIRAMQKKGLESIIAESKKMGCTDSELMEALLITSS